MLDRASTFVVPETLRLLSTLYVPVAVDEWYHVRRQDEEGEYYRHVVFQREGMHAGRTTQGFYVFHPEGTLWKGWNNRDPEKLTRYLQACVQMHHGDSELPRGWSIPERQDFPAEAGEQDGRFERRLAEGGCVVDVATRILGREVDATADRWARIMATATGRDHLWILPDERAALVRGEFPEGLLRRIARYHLVDNTRGEPPFWASADVERLERRPAEPGSPQPSAVRARIELATADGARRYEAELYGLVEVEQAELRRFDLVVRGTFEGHGTWTRSHAPEEPFQLAVAFTLADPEDPRSTVPPQAARDLRGYLAAD